MNYYYDITLDFLENNYPFYEIEKSDNFSQIKKIPLFQVENNILQDFLLNEIKVSQKFLDLIKDETLAKNEAITYAVILADKNNAVAFKFNSDGEVIAYSPLSLNEELNLLEVIYTVKTIAIDYEIKKLKAKIKNRKEEKIRNIILKEIAKLYQEKNISKLQFLYLEWHGTLENDIDLIYKNIKDKVIKQIGKKEENLVKIIEMSYNHV